jgi:hypothetical protein
LEPLLNVAFSFNYLNKKPLLKKQLKTVLNSLSKNIFYAKSNKIPPFPLTFDKFIQMITGATSP